MELLLSAAFVVIVIGAIAGTANRPSGEQRRRRGGWDVGDGGGDSGSDSGGDGGNSGGGGSSCGGGSGCGGGS